MPNHITNTVKADNWEVLKEKLTRQAKTGEDNDSGLVVDFNLVIPQPKDLDIKSGGAEWEAREDYMFEKQAETKRQQDLKIKPLLDLVYEKGMSVDEFLKASKIVMKDRRLFSDVYGFSSNLPNQSVKENIENVVRGYYNLRTYGYPNWYDWRLDKWGTKWNGYHESIDEDSEMITFDTAWACPYEVFEELSKFTPVTVMYADEDTGRNYGIIRFENGKRTILLDDTNRSVGEAYACKGHDFEAVEEDFSEDNYSDEEIEEYFKTDREAFFEKAKEEYDNANRLVSELIGLV